MSEQLSMLPPGRFEVPPEVADFIRRGALVVLNDSGGKDSQAMKILLRPVVPAEQLVIVHADMHGMEWPGTLDHVQRCLHDIDNTVSRQAQQVGHAAPSIRRARKAPRCSSVNNSQAAKKASR